MISFIKDKCLTRGENELQEIFLQEFGKRPKEVFHKIDEQPIAAASLAQVYNKTNINNFFLNECLCLLIESIA